MAAESPIALIYGFNGTSYIETSIRAGIAVPTGQPGFVALGSDGTNTRYLRMASDGTVRVDPTGTTTQPISAASLPLPTGAATETTLATLLTTSAFQARINTLGQKTMANGTPVTIASDQSAIPVSQSGTWTVQPGNTANTTPWLVAGGKTNNDAVPGTNNFGTLPAVATTAAPTYTTGNQVALSTNLSGGLRVDGSGVTQPVSDGGGSLTVDGTVNAVQSGSPWNFSLQQINGNTTLTGNGITGTGSQRVTIASDNTPFTVNAAQSGAWSVGITGSVAVTGPLTDTQLRATPVPISASSLPLPTGAATETTLATRLADSTFTGRINTLGQKVMASSTPVVLASDQSAITVNQGTFGGGANAWQTTLTDTSNNIVKPGDGTNNAIRAVGTAADNSTNSSLKLPVLPARANASAPTWTEGNQAPLSVDNNGALRVTGSLSVGGAADTTASGTLNALNATVQVALAGTAGAAMQLVAGTLVGTIIPEISVDGGTTWVAGIFVDPFTGSKTSNVVFIANNIATTRSILPVAGASHVRIRVSAFTSGTATCNLRASTQNDYNGSSDQAVGGGVPTTLSFVGGRVVAAAPTYIDTAANALTLTTTGSLRVETATEPILMSGTLNALNTTVSTACSSEGSVGFSLAAGSLVGTLVAEVSWDGGTSWELTHFVHPTQGIDSALVFTLANSAQNRTIRIPGGATNARVRVSAFTSGTASAGLRCVDNTESAIQVAGSPRATYSASVSGQANTAASHAIAIEASTKRILVRKVIINHPGTQTTAGVRVLLLGRTTTAGTGGAVTAESTSSTAVLARMCPNDPAFGGIVRAKPTSLGTQGATILVIPVFVPTAAAAFTPIVLDLENIFGKPIIVAPGTAKGIALRDPGAAGGANFSATIIFTEE